MESAFLAMAWVALGAAFGGTARYFVSGIIGRRFGETFPWGTTAVNVSGAFIIGMAAAVAAAHTLPHTAAMWQLIVVGFLGSYTTVSSFSLQTLALARGGQLRLAGGNVLLSVMSCLVAAALGFAAGEAWTGVVAP